MSGPLVAILAAGGATRFGGGKLDAMIGGKRLGRHALDAVRALEINSSPIIVTSDIAPDFAREAVEQGVARVLRNPRAPEGLGTSVAIAATLAAEENASCLLLLLADMPLVSPGTLAHLAALSAFPAAVCHADGNPGIPACFPASWFPALQALDGERGAASLLRDAETQMIDIAPHELRDIDTATDLEDLARLIAP